MRLVLRQGNVLDADADALLLPIDGAARGLEGNVARQFTRRFGAEAWEQIESEVAFPVALGTAAWVTLAAPARFRAVALLSILSHRDNDRAAGYVRSALGEACARAARLGVRTLASPLLRGGWRLGAAAAFQAMLDVVDARRDDDVCLAVYSLLPEHHDYLVGLARSLGAHDE